MPVWYWLNVKLVVIQSMSAGNISGFMQGVAKRLIELRCLTGSGNREAEVTWMTLVLLRQV